MASIPELTRQPVSELESPKLKTAGRLKWLDLAVGAPKKRRKKRKEAAGEAMGIGTDEDGKMAVA